MNSLFDLIFSIEFIHSVIRMATPILFVALAGLIGGKADILCIGYEGIMIFAALGGVVGSAFSKSLMGGLGTGIFLGLLISVVFAYFVLYLNTQPMLIGLAINILGSAGTVFLLFLIAGSKSNSTTLGSLTFPVIDIPLIKDIPILGDVLSGHNLLTYLAFLSVLFVYILIFKTPFGLQIRSVGEKPDAAASVGINVKKTKFIAMLISGVLASLGGIFMSMAYLPYFTRDMTAGRGFIGIAAQSLGGGSPLRTMIWTLVFGAADYIGNLTQSFRLPSQFAQMTPYVVTIIGLTVTSIAQQRKTKTINH